MRWLDRSPRVNVLATVAFLFPFNPDARPISPIRSRRHRYDSVAISHLMRQQSLIRRARYAVRIQSRSAARRIELAHPESDLVGRVDKTPHQLTWLQTDRHRRRARIAQRRSGYGLDRAVDASRHGCRLGQIQHEAAQLQMDQARDWGRRRRRFRRRSMSRRRLGRRRMSRRRLGRRRTSRRRLGRRCTSRRRLGRRVCVGVGLGVAVWVAVGLGVGVLAGVLVGVRVDVGVGRVNSREKCDVRLCPSRWLWS